MPPAPGATASSPWTAPRNTTCSWPSSAASWCCGCLLPAPCCCCFWAWPCAGASAPCGRCAANCSRSRPAAARSEEHTSELQSRGHLVCRLLLEKKKKKNTDTCSDKYHDHQATID